MIFKQFYLESLGHASESLGHASYLVGSEDTGEALVLDVRRDVESYFSAGREQDLVLDRADDLWEVCWQLLRIGYPLPRGWLAGGMLTWRTAGKPIDVLPQWTVRDLRRELREQSNLLSCWPSASRPEGPGTGGPGTDQGFAPCPRFSPENRGLSLRYPH